jgi:hypothetical protein
MHTHTATHTHIHILGKVAGYTYLYILVSIQAWLRHLQSKLPGLLREGRSGVQDPMGNIVSSRPALAPYGEPVIKVKNKCKCLGLKSQIY